MKRITSSCAAQIKRVFIALTVFAAVMMSGVVSAQNLPAPEESSYRVPGTACKARIGTQTGNILYNGVSIMNRGRTVTGIVCPIIEHDDPGLADQPVNRVVVRASHSDSGPTTRCLVDARRADGSLFARTRFKPTGEAFPDNAIIFGDGEIATASEGFVSLYCALPRGGTLQGLEVVRGAVPCVGPGNPDTVCPALYDPVCGCNNQTYSNACFAGRAGITRSTPGVCPVL